MSLLDDVSIVVTPNGYKAGTLYGVLPTYAEGADLVDNGDFATDSDWTKGTGWTISGGSANSDGSGTSFLYQIISNAQTKRFLIEYEVKNYVSGSVSIVLGSAGSDQLTSSSNGVFSGTVIWDGTSDRLNFKSVSLDGSIDNVSVKEYTAADMDVTRATAATRVDEDGLVNYAQVISDTELVTDGDFPLPNVNWTLGGEVEITVEGARIYSSSGGQSYVKQNVLTNTKIYKLTYEIINSTQGSLKLINVNGLSDFPITSTVGTHTAYFTANNNEFFIYRNSGVTDVTIDNVSVKEVIRDNVPRIDYTGGGCPHILAEPQRTNFVAYSIPDNTNWTKGSNTTITENFSTSPDGTQNASRLVMPTGSETYAYYQFTATSTANHTFSFYAKNNGGDADVNMKFFIASQQQSITLTNEWKRFEFTTSITSGNAVAVGVDNLTSIDMLIWGCQCEESYATSYIPTSGSTVTRNQDIFTRDGIGSFINSREGVLFAEIAALADDSVIEGISLSDGTTSNRVVIFKWNASNTIRGRVTSGGTNTLNQSETLSDITSFNKIAIKYKLNDFAIWINGVEVFTDNSGAVPTGLNQLYLSSTGGGLGSDFYGKVKQLQVFKIALSDSELATLTT